MRSGGTARLASACAMLTAALGCTNPFPSPTPTPGPTGTPVPTPTIFSAQQYLQAVAEDADQYPVRYYPPGGEMSIAVPPGWTFNRQSDTGREVDSFSETPEGGPVGAIYLLENIDKDTNPQQALESFLRSDWLADRSVGITETSDFPSTSGAGGWKASGTMAGGTDADGREECLIAAFPADGQAFLLAAYPERSASPDAFRAAWEESALSFRWEETNTRDVEKENALQLLTEESQTLDPALSLDGAEDILGDLYSGLVSFDASLDIRPGLAAAWDVTPDGRTYTFHLREDVRFHNGRPFTADDVVYSWLRAAGPELNSAAAERYLGDILGAAEYHAGEIDSLPGLRAVDAYTLQVTLEASRPLFLEKLTQPATWIVDRYNVRLPNWELYPNGTGPFRMLQRVAGKSLVLEADPDYYEGPARLQYVVYLITVSSPETLYKSGKIDRVEVSRSELPRYADPRDPMFGVVSVEQRLCTDLILFNTELPPFDDPLVRKAFSLAVDRGVYAEVSAAEEDMPGAGLLPPGMPGYAAESGQAPFDPQGAKALLSQSRYTSGGAVFPEVRLSVASKAAVYDATLEFLVDSWEDALGVDILVEGVPAEELEQREAEKPSGQLVFTRQCARYPDPEDLYSSLFHSRSAGLFYGFRNEALDGLLESAAAESDWTARLDLYRQADRILYDEAPAMVLSYPGPDYVVWKPHVLGYVPTPVPIPQHHWMWIQRE
jgi:oligopeptide transport system substrate-binding protein